MNAATQLVDANRARGAKLAFIEHGGGKRTYEELARRTNQAGNALRALGVKRGDRVLMVMRDTLEFPAVFFGAIKLGAVPVPVNTLLKPDDYRHFLADSEATAIVYSAALAESVAPALGGQKALVEGKDLEAVLDRASPELEPAAVKADDIAFWLYSSGSTGKPKGAMHRHHSLLDTAKLYAQPILGIREDDKVYSVAKLFFAYGLGNGMTFPLSVGATAVLLPDRPTPDLVMKVLREHQPTIFYGVPTLYAALVADEKNGRATASQKLRIACSAGEPLPKHVGERFHQRFGAHILDGLGSTEMLHIFLSLRPDDPRYGTSGKPVPGYELRIVGEDGQPVKQGELGELIVRGPTAATGYWKNPEKSKWTFRGGWTYTGDKYTQDENGYYVYSGRSDDMIKSGGIWVSPAEVESAIASHPAVLEAGVVGVADPDGLLKPKAFVVLREGAKATAEELRAFVKERLAPYKTPRWVEFIEALPKTATGKIQRYRLRERG